MRERAASAPRSGCSTRCCRRRSPLATPGAPTRRSSCPRRGEPRLATREKLRQQLRAGRLDEREVEVEVEDAAAVPELSIFTPQGVEEMGVNLQGHAARPMSAGPRQQRRMTVAEAREVLVAAGGDTLIDMDQVRAGGDRARRADRHRVHRRDRQGRPGASGGRGPDVSREGVQRDLLPIVEGSTVHDQARPGADRPRALHRRRRLPRRQALRPDPRAPGPLPDPRRARAARPRRLRAHPHRAAERAHQAVHGAARDRGRRALDFTARRSTSWRGSPPRSTRAPRTSARAACTR